MKDKHFLVVYDKLLIEEIYADFYHDKRVTVTKNLREIHAPLLLFLRRLHFSKKINSKVSLPFKSIWSYNLNNIDFNNFVGGYVIFFDNALFPMKPQYLLKLKEKYDLHYLLFMIDDWNSACGQKSHDYVAKIPFDYIFSIDPRDAEELNFRYTYVPYSMLLDCSVKPPQYDLFYIGAANNDIVRLNLVYNIYEKSKYIHADTYIILPNVKKSMQKHSEGIEYCEPISYAKSLECMKQTNCILEILKGTQSGATLRYYEAVCYNKKLLTNNKNVVNLPFYDPRYMKVFENPEDIDWNWVKERIHVDYHYDGRFSPLHLIDRIIELEDAKKKLLGG